MSESQANPFDAARERLRDQAQASPYLTIEEAAQLARCDPSTLRRAIAAGTLRSFRPAQRLLFTEADVRDWDADNAGADHDRGVGVTHSVAALFVERDGAYAHLPNVDLWDEARDARLYPGPLPVVAHPPCSRWCRLAGLVEARWGHKRGDDDGCFEAALKAVRTYGGVLEHPAWSDAWAAYYLPKPPREGGWVGGLCGGWSCYVEQGRYGHVAKKPTWLYAFGVDLPNLRWGHDPDQRSQALVSWCGNHVKSGESRPRVGKAAAARTPVEFRDALLDMARSATARKVVAA